MGSQDESAEATRSCLPGEWRWEVAGVREGAGHTALGGSVLLLRLPSLPQDGQQSGQQDVVMEVSVPPDPRGRGEAQLSLYFENVPEGCCVPACYFLTCQVVTVSICRNVRGQSSHATKRNKC